MKCSKASIGCFFLLLSCPRSIIFVDLSSLIFLSDGLLPLTPLHIFFSFDYFDSVSIIVSSVQFASHLSFHNICLLPSPRANRPPTLTCDSSRGTSDLILLFFFEFRPCGAGCDFCSILSHYVQTVFSVSGIQFQLHLVPRPFLPCSY
jgi:hypothetical protein